MSGLNICMNQSQVCDLNCSPDKSITHRSLLLAAWASGESTIENPLLGEDCLTTIKLLRQFGVKIDFKNNKAIVNSFGWRRWDLNPGNLDCENSGTTARLLMGILAGLPGLDAVLTGDESLTRRPFKRLVDMLGSFGAQINFEGNSAHSDGLPVRILGCNLKASSVKTPISSAQLKSAVIFAAMGAEGLSEVSLPAGSRNHTEILLNKLGVPLRSIYVDGDEQVVFEGPVTLPPFSWRIPGDPSSAIFIAVFCAIHRIFGVRIFDVLSNPTRNHALVFLQNSGVRLDEVSNLPISQGNKNWAEPVSDWHMLGRNEKLLPMFVEDASFCIDEIPILAVYAAFCEGVSTFCKLDELRVKESDRLSNLCELLERAGIRIELCGENLKVYGSAGFRAKSFEYDARNDHRMYMCAAVLGSSSVSSCLLKGDDVSKISYPEFFTHLQSLGLSIAKT